MLDTRTTLKALLWLSLFAVGLPLVCDAAPQGQKQEFPIVSERTGEVESAQVESAHEADQSSDYVALSQLASVDAPTALSRSVSLHLTEATLEQALERVSEATGLEFVYGEETVQAGGRVSVHADAVPAREALGRMLEGTGLKLMLSRSGKLVLTRDQGAAPERTATLSGGTQDLQRMVERVSVQQLAALRPTERQQGTIAGTVTDAGSGEPLPGVNVVVEGTQQGAATAADGTYEITGVEAGTHAVTASFVGYQEETVQDVTVRPEETTTVNIELTPSTVALEEVVAVGYGTQETEDITGSISKADVGDIEATDVSLTQTMQGSIPGLSVGQVDEAGEEPDLLIRGRTSLSGEQDPLIVVDDVIYRGSTLDLNPSDIESVDILKDASATAVYGSQAANGVIVITTKRGGSVENQSPQISYSGSYAFQEPWRELRAQGPEAFMQKIEHSDLEQARTEESGYTERDPSWAQTTNFKTNHEIEAFEADQPFDWYDHVTADNPYTMKHNLSVGNRTGTSTYYISGGLTRQQGHIRDEGYTRFNGRANLSSDVAKWFEVSTQSSFSLSEFGPQMYSTSDRFNEPYAHPYEIEDGSPTETLVQRPYGNPPNPLIEAQSDTDEKRLNLFGNLEFSIEFPVEGLSYNGNVANNFRTVTDYFFGPHVSSFQGGGHKNYSRFWDISTDQIISYDNIFYERHDIGVTLLAGLERRTHSFTNASASNFSRQVLGYNRLQDGESDQHSVSSGGWKETSLYSMGRVNYVFDNKYMLTATLRRDGFSGFSDQYKWGYFPSIALGWVISEESFFNVDWVDRLKVRASYGTTGNRTIDRYETLAKVSVGSGYVTGGGSSMLTQRISDLASPSLQWEETTGIDVGVDFDVLNERVSGSVDYYNKNTSNLLYQVDIPGMTGFETFPDNLGEIHNHGFELSVSSTNIQRDNFQWETEINFSRNRNQIEELLGFDTDGDGQEDDLISEGLFIGEPLSAIYDYEIDGIWQPGDDIPNGYQFGSYKVVDKNGDGEITSDDKTILGAASPSFRFGVRNQLSYNNWSLSFFINSIQGGSSRYLGEDTLYGLSIFNTETHFNSAFPEGLDYWTPSNTNARYQRPGISGASGVAGTRYAQRNFVRLKNLRLQYRLDENLLEFFSIQSLSIYLSGRNLVTLTDWNGWDPETGAGISYGGRPVMRSFTVGMNLSL